MSILDWLRAARPTDSEDRGDTDTVRRIVGERDRLGLVGRISLPGSLETESKMSNGSERERAQAQMKPVVDERRVAAWIGKAVFVRGDVVCSGDLTIDGKFEGTIEVGDHGLTIGADATIKADLVAKTITIEGTVIGNVTARERLELRPTGSVEGDIRAHRFAMADGAVLRGKVETGGKGTPSTP